MSDEKKKKDTTNPTKANDGPNTKIEDVRIEPLADDDVDKVVGGACSAGNCSSVIVNPK